MKQLEQRLYQSIVVLHLFLIISAAVGGMVLKTFYFSIAGERSIVGVRYQEAFLVLKSSVFR